MKVCVIIPNYNHHQWLDESIRSAIAQTYKDIEILVVDDGSSDKEKVKSIVRENSTFDNRVKYIDLPKNTGKWNALNEAIKSTSCKLITTLDADDVCPADRIERQAMVFKELPNVLHLLTGFHHCWTPEELSLNKTILQTKQLNIVLPPDVRQMVLTGFATPGINHYFTGNIETAGASAMFYRDLWEVGFRFNPPRLGLRTLLSEDSDFNFRVTATLGRTAILNEKLYCYRRNTSTNEETK